MKKGEITRRLNLLAGVRPPLPGHYHLRETNLRLELSECFEPVNAIEMLWVSDIAYCTAVIEMQRVQIAGFRLRILKEARKAERNAPEMPRGHCQSNVAGTRKRC